MCKDDQKDKNREELKKKEIMGGKYNEERKNMGEHGGWGVLAVI